MSFAAVVQWWEAWQLRILAISSLMLQWFLFFSAASRKFQIRGWFRFFIWLSYLSSDALAIYALATLYNRHNNQAASSARSTSTAIERHGLEVLWAPVLLIHLAGQDTITAYNIEDNELWTRHVITVVSQITVAVYVFYMSWSGEKRLLQAAVILFLAGILRCSEKPWALHRASINSLVSNPPAGSLLSAFRKQRGWQQKRILNTMQRLAGPLFTECFKTFSPGTSLQNQVETDDGEGEDDQEGEITLTLQGYIQHAAQFFAEYEEEGADSAEQGDQNYHEENNDEKQDEELEKAIPHLPTEPRKLFVDLPFPYARRLCILKSFFRLDAPSANRVLQAGLSNTFDLLYTKERVFQTDYGLFVRTGGMILNFASLGLSCKSHKHDYDKEDVIVTYILLAGTAALEALAYARLVCLNNDFVPRSSRVLNEPPNNNPLDQLWDRLLKRTTEAIRRRLNIPTRISRSSRDNNYYRFRSWLGRPRWSKAVAQYNLLDSFTRDTRPTVLSKVASWFSCKDYLDLIQHVEYKPSSGGITEAVLAYVRRGWIEYIHDVATYKRFNNRRGQWTLERYCRELLWSVQKPFDESILLWHIATDLCLRQRPVYHQEPDQQGRLIARCREMSNYMIYLLFVQPEMLLAGTRRSLFTAAVGELEELFVGNGKKPPLEDSVLSREIFAEASGGPATSIHDACVLGRALRRLGDDKMWEVVEGVWVEMLCYSGSRCRGYLHAKSLGSGGEYLSYVWMLLSYMGMESLADRFQQPEPAEEDDAGPSTSQSPGARV